MNVRNFLNEILEKTITINKIRLEKALIEGKEFKVDPFNGGKELIDILEQKVMDMAFQNHAQSRMEEQDIYTGLQILEVEDFIKDLKSIGDLEDLPLRHKFLDLPIPGRVVRDWEDSTEIEIEIALEELEEVKEWRR